MSDKWLERLLMVFGTLALAGFLAVAAAHITEWSHAGTLHTCLIPIWLIQLGLITVQVKRRYFGETR